jgi:hypothetical protein
VHNLTSKIDFLNAKLNTLIISINVVLYEKKSIDLKSLGELICKQNLHNLENGGLWLWDYNTNEVFYSFGFCEALEYQYGQLGNGFEGFDRGDQKDMAKGIEMINKLIDKQSIDPFINRIKYTTKSNKEINVNCVGSVFYKEGKPYLILGTHKIL